MWCQEFDICLLANIYTYIYIYIDITLSISDVDFLYQFNLSLHHFWGVFFFNVEKKNVFQKLAGLWLVGEVVNHVGLYGSKVVEGCSAFQRRSCLSRVSRATVGVKLFDTNIENINDTLIWELIISVKCSWIMYFVAFKNMLLRWYYVLSIYSCISSINSMWANILHFLWH